MRRSRRIPNSFEETNFHAPAVSSSRAVHLRLSTGSVRRSTATCWSENSSNGLFVRISTPAGDAQNQLTVAGRFDDTDVVHVLAENLVIAGQVGRADPGTGPSAGERGDAGAALGRADGAPARTTTRSCLSTRTASKAGRRRRPRPSRLQRRHRSVRLDKLPAATGDFVARRIYRSESGVAGPYVFVAQINTSDAAYTDTKSRTSWT